MREYFGESTAGTPKDYGLSFGDFQIQFEVRGAKGIDEDMDKAIFPNADITTKWGNIPQKLPIVIAGLGSTYVAKRNWIGLAHGAALSGCSITVGENVCGMDSDAKFENGSKYPRVVDTEDMMFRVKAFREFWDGKNGDIIIQRNVEDTRLGVFEYVTSKLDVTSLEEKFGQGAKAIGGEVRLESLDRAQLLAKRGYLVIPDPFNPDVIEQYKSGHIMDFERHSRVGITTTEAFLEGIDKVKAMGIKNLFIKTGAYRPSATAWIIRLGVEGKVDGMTFDGAGGGTGMSPVTMMNEGSIPTVYLEAMVTGCLDMIKHKTPSAKIPTIAIAGGLANETHMFKAIAMGAPYVTCMAMARAPITAAMKGAFVEKSIKEHSVTKSMLESLGFDKSKDPASLTMEEAFIVADELKRKYPGRVITGGAMGVYSYFTNRLGTGLKQLLAGVRKFKLNLLDRRDIACISDKAYEVCKTWGIGVERQDTIDIEEVKDQIFSGRY